METNIGIWRVYLIDDGTLDTVLCAEMRIQPHIVYESRFSGEYVDGYRDDDGYLTEEGFRALAEDAAEWADDCLSLDS